MVIHWGHKTYICDVCGKGFMSRKHFKDHMRIHAGEQPHRCETCGKDFIYYRYDDLFLYLHHQGVELEIGIICLKLMDIHVYTQLIHILRVKLEIHFSQKMEKKG